MKSSVNLTRRLMTFAFGYRAIAALEAADIIREITGDKRHQVWAAHELLEAVDVFNARLRRRVTSRKLGS